jgi:hypothetical protein
MGRKELKEGVNGKEFNWEELYKSGEGKKESFEHTLAGVYDTMPQEISHGIIIGYGYNFLLWK